MIRETPCSVLGVRTGVGMDSREIHNLIGSDVRVNVINENNKRRGDFEAGTYLYYNISSESLRKRFSSCEVLPTHVYLYHIYKRILYVILTRGRVRA